MRLSRKEVAILLALSLVGMMYIGSLLWQGANAWLQYKQTRLDRYYFDNPARGR